MDGERTRAVGAGRAACAILAAALAPAVLRVALLVRERGGAGIEDLGGALSDAAVVAGFLVLLIGAGALSRGLAGGLAALWAVVHYANYENVRALDALASVADVRFLGDLTFVRGSALWISSPILLGVVVVASAALGFLGGGALRMRHAVVALAVSGLGLGAHVAWMQGRAPIGWRYADFVHVNAARVGARLVGSDASDSGESLVRLHPELAADLSGVLRHERAPDARRNVLVVMVEGLSGAFLPSHADAHGTFTGPLLERLDRVAQANLRFTTFVTHQRRTNRGLYAALCGELPNLTASTPKMSAFASGGGPRCLPHALSDAGYRTVYLQAAPLAFMLKDQFMPRAGFDRVLGRASLGPGYAESVWGIDDRAFFEQALDTVDELVEEQTPWFLTLLTVGTHHPTLVPDDYEPGGHRFARALSYADRALDAFLRALESRGVLDDTLVLVTSDESRGSARGRSDAAAALTQSWGVAIALAPERLRGEVTAAYGLVDLPVSILDYLGLEDAASAFQGRSLFRDYANGRTVFFGNLNLDLVGAITPDRNVVLCPATSRECTGFDAPNGRVFSHEIRERPGDAALGAQVRRVARASAPAFGSGLRDLRYPLGTATDFAVRDARPQLVHGGQDVDVRAEQWLEVEIAADVLGDPGAVGHFEHYLEADGWSAPKHFELPLRGGGDLRLRYTLRTDAPLESVRCRSFVRLDGDAPITLRFQRAELSIRTLGDRPPPGLQLHERRP